MTHNRERLEECLQGLLAGKHALRQVLLRTSCTRQRLCVLENRCRKEGAACLVNGRKGKPSLRAIPQATKDKIVSIYKKDFIYDGAEDGIIPHARSLEESELGIDGGAGGIEEERWLFYVAITRAQDKLYISSCASRRKGGSCVECATLPLHR